MNNTSHQRTRPYRRIIAAVVMLGFATLSLSSGQQAASNARPGATVHPLTRVNVKDAPDKELAMFLVEYPPNGASMPHEHNAEVIVFMLEGEMLMQVGGKSPTRIGPGETFVEAPGDVHVRSENPSKANGAKLLVVMLKDRDAAASMPVDAQARLPGE